MELGSHDAQHIKGLPLLTMLTTLDIHTQEA